MAHILPVLRSNRNLKGRINNAQAVSNISRKRWALNKLFQYLGYDCLLSSLGLDSAKSVRRKANQISEAKERILESDERNGVKSFKWWRECEDASCLSNTGNASSLSETRPEATENCSAEISDRRQQLFGHDAALDDCYTFLGYTSCSDEGDKVQVSIVWLSCLNVWFATVVTSLTERWRREGHRQKNVHIRMLLDCGHQTVRRMWSHVFKSVKTRRAVFCTS